LEFARSAPFSQILSPISQFSLSYIYIEVNVPVWCSSEVGLACKEQEGYKRWCWYLGYRWHHISIVISTKYHVAYCPVSSLWGQPPNDGTHASNICSEVHI